MCASVNEAANEDIYFVLHVSNILAFVRTNYDFVVFDINLGITLLHMSVPHNNIPTN